MKKCLLILLALSLTSLCLNCAHIAAQRKKHRGFTINTGGEQTITDCGQLTLRVDDLQVVRSEQERSLPKSAVSSLQIQAAYHGGIQVSGWDRDHYSIKACLGAAGNSAAEAQKLLAQLTLSTQDGRVTVTGPDDESWMGYLIIQAPNGAMMELEAKNAPIGVSSITGNIAARNQNGPVTLRDVDGRVSADVMNGPITVAGSRGEHRLNVRNGPLTVELLGSRWESGELEGRTENGPVTLSLPPDYQSAVQVDTSKHSPVVCRAAQCKEAARTWDRPNLLAFGGPNPVIRLSTVNGPTTVTSSGAK
ncbi:MAG TPA: hypothetical protein VJ810_20890 [Blastocatellia bacterium]|nr:hypothetical protein [Blastocatellia bacterium]